MNKYELINSTFKENMKNIIILLLNFSVIALIIGLPTLCMGYNENIGININRYIKVNGHIISPFHAIFKNKNTLLNCRFLTSIPCGLTTTACNNYARIHYPIGSNITLFYDSTIGICRTTQFVNNLFYVGCTFLLLSILFKIIATYLVNKYDITNLIISEELHNIK